MSIEAGHVAPGRRPALPGWAWAPVPILLLTVLALWVADLRTPYESRTLLVLANFVFTWLVSVCVAVVAGRGFLTNGQPGLLLFGCGALVWGCATLLSNAFVNDGANVAVTIHNVGVLGAALCYVGGLARRERVKRPGRWLGAGYAGVLVAVVLLAWTAAAGWTPTFFVQGQGGTLLRQVVLGSAVGLLAVTAWFLFGIYRRQPTSFFYFYAAGLALLATGLAGVWLQTVQGSVLGWTGRVTQCLGGAYLFVAALSAAKEAGLGKLSVTVPEALRRNATQQPTLPEVSTRWLALRYLLAAAAVAAALGAQQALSGWVGPPGLPRFILFYPAVMVVALLAGFGPGLLATALTLIAVNVWLMPPIGQWDVTSPADRLALVIFAINGALICVVAELYRRNRERATTFARELALREGREALRRHAELVDPIRADLITQEMQRVVRERGGTPAAPPEPASGALRRVPAVAGALVACVGLLALIGWAFGVGVFTRVLPGLATMKANTAACFLLAGVALAWRDRRAVRWACAGLVGTVAGLTLVECLTGANFGIDQLLFRDTRDLHTLVPGRMVQATAVGFLLGSASLMLAGARSRPARLAQQVLASGVGVIGVIAVLGYAYNVQELYRFAGYSSMALHTAISFVLLAAGLILARPDGLARVLTGPGPAAQLARRLLPAAVLAPAVLGWLADYALEQRLYGQGMDIAALALAMMLSLSALVWWTARVLDRADAARRDAEAQLRNQAEVMDQASEALIVREMGGAIRSWNRGAEALYGWAAADVIGVGTHRLFNTPASSVQEFEAALAEAGHWEGELGHTTRDGRLVIVEARKTATRTPDGRVLVLESNRDITARKRAEEAASRNQKTFMELVERSPFGTYVVDSQFRIAVMNAASQNGAFRNVRPVTGRDFGEAMRILWPEPVAAEIIGHFRHTLETGEPFYSPPFINARHDVGVVESYEWELRRMTLPDGEYGVICYYFDATKLRQAEAALRESEARLRFALESCQIGAWDINLEDQTAYRSLEHDRIFGYPELLPSWTFDDFLKHVLPEHRAPVEKMVREATAARTDWNDECQIRRADGQTRWIWFSGRHHTDNSGRTRVAGIVQDITVRKQAEDALRAAKDELEQRVGERTAQLAAAGEKIQAERQRLFDVLETLPAMICLLTPDHHVAFANRGFRDQFGEANGRRCYEYCFGLAEPCDFCESYQVLQNGQPHHWEVTTPDGETIIEAHDYPFTDVDGSPLILEMDLDVTDRRRAEAALHDRTEKLRAMASELTLAEQRERQKLARVLHDGLQQLLVAANLRVAMMGRSKDASARLIAQEVGELLTTSIETSRRLTAELSPPVLEESGLVPAFEWLARWVEEKHHLTMYLDARGPEAVVSQDVAIMLFHATRELLFNVVKHAGVMSAHVQVVRQDGEIRIEVSDEGAGFDPGALDAGNGVSGRFGLFSIRERLGLLGGRLEIESAPGRGSRFTLVAPLAAKSPEETRAEDGGHVSVVLAHPGASGSADAIRVVLVDDHVVVRQGLTGLLRFEPDIAIVGEASDGASAVALVRQVRPDVVLMDISMPGMNGIEATRIIHAEMPEVRVVGLSMFDQADQADAMREAGAVGYLSKSGPVDALVEAIRRWART